MSRQVSAALVVDIIDSSSDDDSSSVEVVLPPAPELLEFNIPGQPVGMPRPRVHNGGVYQPHLKDLQRAQALIRDLNLQRFPPEVPLCLEVKFYIKRPLNDFVGNRRDQSTLKTNRVNNRHLPMSPDIDNLLKFAMDALSGLAYQDDKQVVKVMAERLRDNLGQCEGGTHFRLFPSS